MKIFGANNIKCTKYNDKIGKLTKLDNKIFGTSTCCSENNRSISLQMKNQFKYKCMS